MGVAGGQNAMGAGCWPGGRLFPGGWPLGGPGWARGVVNKLGVKHRWDSGTGASGGDPIRATALGRSVMSCWGGLN